MIQISNRKVGDQYPCFIVAEAGVNHNGKIEIAKELVKKASEAYADAVKFQSFKVSDLILSHVEKAPYQQETSSGSQSQTKMLEDLQIDRHFHEEIIEYCKTMGIIFLSTPYNEGCLNLLLELDVPAIKVASTDTTNLLFLEKVARSGKPVILSTGMCTFDEIEQAYLCLVENGCKEIAILKCTSNYPTQEEEVNLRGIGTLKNSFEAVIGFSDHTESIGATPYAVAMEAKIVEKHFTIDKSMKGPDHKASLDPEELKDWVRTIKRVESMMGRKHIIPTDSEKVNKLFLQKNLVAKKAIKKGEEINNSNIVAKRTGGRGIKANEGLSVLGIKAARNININEIIYHSYLSYE